MHNYVFKKCKYVNYLSKLFNYHFVKICTFSDVFYSINPCIYAAENAVAQFAFLKFCDSFRFSE